MIAAAALLTTVTACSGDGQERASSDVAGVETTDDRAVTAGSAVDPCGRIDRAQLDRVLGGPASEREVYAPPEIAEFVCAFELDEVGGADVRLLAFDGEEVFENFPDASSLPGVGERAVEWSGSTGMGEAIVITFVVDGSTYSVEFNAASDVIYIDGTDRMYLEAMTADLADAIAAG